VAICWGRIPHIPAVGDSDADLVPANRDDFKNEARQAVHGAQRETLVLTLLKVRFSAGAMPVIETMMPSAMMPAIIAYSMDVMPPVCRAKRAKTDLMTPAPMLPKHFNREETAVRGLKRP
jgi:hypothetical protein